MVVFGDSQVRTADPSPIAVTALARTRRLLNKLSRYLPSGAQCLRAVRYHSSANLLVVTCATAEDATVLLIGLNTAQTAIAETQADLDASADGDEYWNVLTHDHISPCVFGNGVFERRLLADERWAPVLAAVLAVSGPHTQVAAEQLKDRSMVVTRKCFVTVSRHCIVSAYTLLKDAPLFTLAPPDLELIAQGVYSAEILDALTNSTYFINFDTSEQASRWCEVQASA
jgi:hypothetical protein